MFSELVVVLVGDGVVYIGQEVMLFKALHKMYETRPFKLVFLLEGPYPGLGEARSVLARGLECVTAKGLLDFLSSPPAIRIARSHYYGWDSLAFD